MSCLNGVFFMYEYALFIYLLLVSYVSLRSSSEIKFLWLSITLSLTWFVWDAPNVLEASFSWLLSVSSILKSVDQNVWKWKLLAVLCTKVHLNDDILCDLNSPLVYLLHFNRFEYRHLIFVLCLFWKCILGDLMSAEFFFR